MAVRRVIVTPDICRKEIHGNRIVGTGEPSRVSLGGNQFEVASGELELTPEQAGARKHCLKHLCMNRYQVMQPVCFKLGEAFGIVE